jgi:hypothetical protein
MPLRYVRIPILDFSLERKHKGLRLRSGVASVGFHRRLELHQKLLGIVVSVVLGQGVGVESTGPWRALELDRERGHRDNVAKWCVVGSEVLVRRPPLLAVAYALPF